jgi:hypothetical protein
MERQVNINVRREILTQDKQEPHVVPLLFFLARRGFRILNRGLKRKNREARMGTKNKLKRYSISK